MTKISVGWCICALVDDEDFEYLSQWRWHHNDSGYAVHTDYNTRQTIRMHRVVLERKLGHSDFEECDHIDRKQLNNQRENLRASTHQQNLCNSSKQKNNTSGYIGVSWCNRDKKFQAKIQIDEETIHLGQYDCKIMAARVRDLAAIEYHGEFAVLNFDRSNYQ